MYSEENVNALYASVAVENAKVTACICLWVHFDFKFSWSENNWKKYYFFTVRDLRVFNELFITSKTYQSRFREIPCSEF